MRPIVLAALSAFSLLLTPTAHADILTYDVTGNIDTNDFLIIQGSTFQWHHTDTGGAAVGRHSGNNFPTVISTTLNGVTQMDNTDWIPTWPYDVPHEIRFDAFSSILTGITPILPSSVPLSVDTSVISGRGSLSITQLPDSSDDYTLIVNFNDGFNGSSDLRALITVVTPEPATATLLIPALALVTRRRSRALHRTHS